MEGFTMRNDIILLFDRYSQDDMSLHESFKRAGYDLPVVVLEDDGFLPDEVLSVYSVFLDDLKGMKGIAGRPLYFNEIAVPHNWEIGGIGKEGKIHCLQEEKGQIRFAEHTHKGFVKTVEWYDRKGTVRISEHYNRYGVIYARTVHDGNGQRINKTWFAASGGEIIVENFITGDMILNETDGRVRHFRTKMDFILYALERLGYTQSRVFFNSLSTPFFIAQQLKRKEKRDMLFWQEPVGEEIPWNMQMILQGALGDEAQIMVQKKCSYDKLLRLGVPKDRVHRLGFIYPFQKENSHKPEAFICTNSDHIEHCEEIVKALPQMNFHIAALTTMSPKLIGLEKYDNVNLYPLIWMDDLNDFFERCDYYLDINHGSEVASSIRRAFIHNNLIVAFRETVHNSDYTAEENLYAEDKAERMVSELKKVMMDENLLEERLRRQREAALAAPPERYREVVLLEGLTEG